MQPSDEPRDTQPPRWNTSLRLTPFECPKCGADGYPAIHYFPTEYGEEADFAWQTPERIECRCTACGYSRSYAIAED